MLETSPSPIRLEAGRAGMVATLIATATRWT